MGEATMAMQTGQGTGPLPSCWPELTRYRSANRFSLQSAFIVSDSALSDRLTRLLATKPAKRVLDLLEPLTPTELSHVRQVAETNASQAEAEFRRSSVFNVSWPIALIAAVSQLAPSWTASLFDDVGWDSHTLMILAAALWIVATVAFAFLRSRDARDLADIVALVHASRGP